MDSEAVLHFVAAKNEPLRIEAGLDPTPMKWRFPERTEMLTAAERWCEKHCSGPFDAWIQYGEHHIVVAQFENPDDAFAFRMRFG